MPRLLQRQVDQLKQHMMTLGLEVQGAFDMSVRSLTTGDAPLAEKVEEGDARIDQMEVDFEEECLKVLALYQPVANDLRLIVAVMKINNDLERIGDLAVNIARRSLYLSRHPPRLIIPEPMRTMASIAKRMLEASLESFLNLDGALAYRVMAWDDDVDNLLRQMYLLCERDMQAEPHRFAQYMRLIAAARFIERVADHCTNIAEDVLYMLEGEIVRHRLVKEKLDKHRDVPVVVENGPTSESGS
jgi:phosphate transport system protein